MNDIITILVNSTSNTTGLYIAGKNSRGIWRRIVKPYGSPIPTYEGKKYTIPNGLRVVNIRAEKSESNYHSENVLYDYCEVLNPKSTDGILKLLDTPEDIFGTKTKISYEEAQKLTESLLFVEVQNLKIYARGNGLRPLVRCNFVYNGNEYNDMKVTDTETQLRFKSKEKGNVEEYFFGYITIELGQEYEGYVEKHVVGIFLI